MRKVECRVQRMKNRLENLQADNGLTFAERAEWELMISMIFTVVAEEIEASRLTASQSVALSCIENIGGVYNE